MTRDRTGEPWRGQGGGLKEIVGKAREEPREGGHMLPMEVGESGQLSFGVLERRHPGVVCGVTEKQDGMDRIASHPLPTWGLRQMTEYHVVARRMSFVAFYDFADRWLDFVYP